MSVLRGPSGNIRVTYDIDPKFDRSESDLAANPLDPRMMVGASKRFSEPAKYEFTVAAYHTEDAGMSWCEAPPLELIPGAVGVTDPVVAWDGSGHAFLVTQPFTAAATIGICVYRSPDGGHTWGSPTMLHTSSNDDKPAAAGDNNPASPHYGNVYAVWDDGLDLRFARTLDEGATWRGAGADPPGSSIFNGGPFAPDVMVAADGTLYVVWLTGREIVFVKSTDGGDSFFSESVAVSGLTPLSSPPLSAPDGFPELPGGIFRVLTIVTGCAGAGQALAVAWADYREGVSRIYYRRSIDGGATWLGPVSGQPLLSGPVASRPNQHDFHPQLNATPNGDIGCVFYEFGPPPQQDGPPLIHVILAASIDSAASFASRATVTDRAWDPAINAPLSHGKPTTTFIGDYFGLAASTLGFFPFWTDTRTGIQEIFSARLTVNPASRYLRDPLLVFFHVDNPAGENRGFYRVAKALRRDGRVPASAWSWTDPVDFRFQVPGWFGDECQAGSVAVTDLDDDGRPDLLVFHIDNPSGENHGYYRAGMNMRRDGVVDAFDWHYPVLIPGWFGEDDQGGGIAVADLGRNGGRDLIVFHIDHASGGNRGWYRVGKGLDATGNVTGGWLGPLPVPGWFGDENQGGGIAVVDLDGTGNTDLIVFHVDNPSGDNHGWYRVGKDMQKDGTVVSWQGPYQIPGWFGTESQGGGVAVLDLDGNGQADLLVFHLDNPSGENHGHYRIGKNLDTSGRVTGGWLGPFEIPGWFGFENQGGGVAVAWPVPLPKPAHSGIRDEKPPAAKRRRKKWPTA